MIQFLIHQSFKMKKTINLITCVLLLLSLSTFFSCSEHDPLEPNMEVISRSACKQECSSYEYDLYLTNNNIGVDCCEYYFNVTEYDCEMIVYINGMPWDSSENYFRICDSDVLVIEFYETSEDSDGIDLCFTERVSCCCNDVSMEITNFENRDGCCVYDVQVENNSDCILDLYGTKKPLHSSVPVPMGTSNYSVNLCRLDTKQLTIKDGDKVCETILLNEICESCCPEGTIEVNHNGGDPDQKEGCCLYKVIVNNDSPCTLQVSIEGEMYTIAPFDKLGPIGIFVCEGEPSEYVIVYDSVTGEPCMEVELDSICFN